MRRVPHVPVSHSPLILPGFSVTERDPDSFQGLFTSGSSEEQLAACVRCSDAPCRITTHADNHVIELCPVDVLARADASDGVTVGHGCIACGICVIRCPIGALSLGPSGAHALQGSTSLQGSVETSDEATFFEWLHHAGYYPALTPASREMLIGAFLQTASRHLGPIFYRLVESLFNAVGVPARRSNPGDTSNRIDLILTDEVEPLPVEIKSRTEVPAINVKSIQQALENKLTITRLYGRAELSSSSSLVVGFDYPADRTGILELIDDIDSSFGIRIGMVSLRRLYELFLASNLDDVPVSRNALATLKGPL